MTELTSLQTHLDLNSALKAKAPTRDLTPLRFITCGSVDDGKSTLIGRLLWDTKAVPDDVAEASRSASDVVPGQLNLPDFANLLDGLQAEREQGITIDVAYRYFSTSKRSFIVADTPGHAQYTRNMATGASTADLAVLLVDARSGILEQTRRHATIVSLMGITQVILAVNKIDLVDYDQNRFDQIVTEFKALAAELGLSSVVAIPTSAVNGDNVAVTGSSALSWHDGPTLLEALELAPRRSEHSSGLRLSVQRVSRPDESFRGYQGTIAGGAIKPGDGVMVLPSGNKANIKKIVTFDLVRNAGVAGDAVTLVLDREVDISRGDMIVSLDDQPEIGQAFDAKLIVLDDNGVQDGKQYWLKSASRRQKVSIVAQEILDLRHNKWTEPEELGVNQIAIARLDFDEPAIFDAYATNRNTGSFILIDPDTNNTVAGGMIIAPSDNALSVDNAISGDMTAIFLPTELAEKLEQTTMFKEHAASLKQIKLHASDVDKFLERQ